jgi:hypothetical protein
MIIIYNFITLFKYLISKNTFYIEFEYIKEDDMDDDMICYCNLCNTIRNIILFTIR